MSAVHLGGRAICIAAVRLEQPDGRIAVIQHGQRFRIGSRPASANILLGVKSKIFPLGNKAANEFVIPFTGTLLVRRGRITVKEKRIFLGRSIFIAEMDREKIKV